MSRYKCQCGYVSRKAEERDLHAQICGCKAHLHQRLVRHLVKMAERVVKDADARHRQISKGHLVYGDCLAVHHEHIYDLGNAIEEIKAEMPNH